MGIIVRKTLEVEMEEIKVGECEMSEDIFAIRITLKEKGKKGNILLVVCYMTVEGRNGREDNVKKYEMVGRLTKEHKRDQVIVMGDMNGHIGILGENINGNGELLLSFAEENDLEILNVTMAEGRVTWRKNMCKSAIDYILVNENARKRVQ